MSALPPLDPTAPRIFLDTSVIFSGLMSQRGASHAILVLAELGLLRPVTCDYVMEEVQNSLQRKVPEILPLFEIAKQKIHWEYVDDPSDEAVRRWISVISDPEDTPILAAAVLARPSRLVTLDTAHFLSSSDVAARSGVPICTPGDLLREIRNILAQGLKTTE